jgi:RNA polymerase sporulation-specific sigma factor
MVGLCKAANTWRDDKSEFSTYASRCILNEINLEFRNRKKHSNNLSLDYEVDGKGSEVIAFGELLTGDEDVNYIDYDSVDAFYDTLTDVEKEILRLRRSGLTSTEIGERVGYARNTVSWKLRQLRNKWGKFNGN